MLGDESFFYITCLKGSSSQYYAQFTVEELRLKEWQRVACLLNNQKV